MKLDKVLLIINEIQLSQLYHEVLIASGYETIITEHVETAFPFLIISSFQAVIIFDNNQIESIENILDIRKKHRCWQKTQVIIVSVEDHFPFNINKDIDIVVNPLLLSPGEIVARIKHHEVDKITSTVPKAKRETS